VLALLRAKSPILGSLAASVFSDAARFRVKRIRGEMGACCSGRACFREPRRLESVEMLTGDRGVSRLRWPISIDAAIIAGRYSGGEEGKNGQDTGPWGRGDTTASGEESMNGLLVEGEMLCTQCPLMSRKTMMLPVGHPMPSS
jgi:hypothetical protein